MYSVKCSVYRCTFMCSHGTEIDRWITSKREKKKKEGEEISIISSFISSSVVRSIGSKIESIHAYHGTFISSLYRDIRVVDAL